MDPPPMRVPEGTKISSMGSRSIFDNPAPGSTAQLSQVSLRPDPFTPREVQAVARPTAVAQPVMGQEGAVEKVIQREIPPEGVSKEEATAIVAALGPALDATAKAIEDGVTCGKVDSLVYAEVKKLKGSLEQFAASKTEAKADLSASELEKIDAVLSCQLTYQDIASVKKQRTIAIVVGGIVIGALVIAVVS